jgi:hypothetical protein
MMVKKDKEEGVMMMRTDSQRQQQPGGEISQPEYFLEKEPKM